MSLRSLFIFGTRPEAIKLAPLVKEMQRRGAAFDVRVCLTGQHREMLDQVVDFFGIPRDYDLNLMTPGQSLHGYLSQAIARLGEVIGEWRPHVAIAQGDTSSTLAGAIAAYYHKVPVAHVEAGLRTNDWYAPFPEEGNRRLASHVTTYHFAPTARAVENLAREGIVSNVWAVGNTVVDAFAWAAEQVRRHEGDYAARFPFAAGEEPVVLITGHRRESFGEPFGTICAAISELARERPRVRFVYPVHLNPNVRGPVHQLLGTIPNVNLIEPVTYPEMVWLMTRARLVLTDSGGVQEEAPTLGKPVLVMRDVTERPEGVEAGVAKLVGTNREAITRNVRRLLDDAEAYARMSGAANPYGDGKASERIADVLAGAGSS